MMNYDEWVARQYQIIQTNQYKSLPGTFLSTFVNNRVSETWGEAIDLTLTLLAATFVI